MCFLTIVKHGENMIKPPGGIHFQFLEILSLSIIFILVISLVVSKFY